MDDAQDQHRESVRALADGKPSHRRLLIILAISAAVMLIAVFFVRTFIANKHDTDLCKKLDRFTVVLEKGVIASPILSPQEKQDRLRLYENFRNDPPSCRTPGP